MAKIDRDEISGTETTGHEWDGIKELNTPMPRWWLWTFYATVVWALGYTIAYPAWPLINRATPGLLGYSSRIELSRSLELARADQALQLERIRTSSLEDIVKDQALLQFARAGGAAAFKVNCVQCHGSGAAGSPGYPNLNDDDWIWGGSLEDIHKTLESGVRFTINPETRDALMPAFGADAILTPEQVNDVANYVVSLSGGEGVDQEAAGRGKLVFAENDNCVACHGADGKGKREMGGPNLADGIWLYGGTVEAVKAQVTKPRHGVMPAWGGRLDEATIKQLAVYVHSLGGGE